MLLDAAGNVKLGDFGLATQLASDSKLAQVSEGGWIEIARVIIAWEPV